MNLSVDGTLAIYPLTPARWADLEALFGTAGAQSRCWCMWWRLTNADYHQDDPTRNRDALKALVEAGQAPGLLAYRDGQPVGWCGLGRRTGFARLSRTRALGPFDDEPVWSIVCFFVARQERRRGVALALLRAAVRWAAAQGAPAVEGYPIAAPAQLHAANASPGTVAMFEAAGFHEVRVTAAKAREGGASRVIMRHDLAG